MLEHFSLFFISLISNVFSAFSGGGAGVIQLPAILLIFNLPFVAALASHKIATVALGLGASLRFLKEKTIEKKFFFESILIGGPGVILGASLIGYVDNIVARILLGVLIIFISIYSYLQKETGLNNSNFSYDNKHKFVGFLVIFLIGVINGSLSAGTGLFFTIWMVVWYGMSYKKAITYTLVIVGFFYNAIGAITLATYANIFWLILPALFFGSLIGGYLGAHIALSKDDKTIKNVYQIVTLVVGLKLIFS
ncbi:MAG: sulfite exporter TauE/SafE family protein [Pseudomonadota bacterium]|nr:sulfite exporter TauE/SafE family protein [Pseudomonadota bacterium]